MRSTEGFSFRYETHCHTSWCSACAHSSPKEMAQAYYEKGYAGIVITDHFLRGNTAVDPTLSWEEKVACYWNAYLDATEFAQGKDFSVLFGLEHMYGGGKEVLTYGIDLSFLQAHPGLHLFSLEEYARLVHEAGGVISMAHPYRTAPYIDSEFLPQPQYLDGAEVFNFFNKNEENKQAVVLAEKNGLFPTSGGDVHHAQSEAIGMAGIALKAPISTGKELVEALKSRDYRLVIGGELV